MFTRFLTSSVTALSAATLVLMAGASISGQAPSAAPKAAPAAKAVRSTYVMKRLPWGDPDISGNFTTKDEANTPFELDGLHVSYRRTAAR